MRISKLLTKAQQSKLQEGTLTDVPVVTEIEAPKEQKIKREMLREVPSVTLDVELNLSIHFKQRPKVEYKSA